MDEGIYFGLPAEAYHAAPGLSHSGMRDLAVSPLHYWHRHLSPSRRPHPPTPAQRLGSAVHCRVLEPDEFTRRYARDLSREDYPSALVTVDDLKAWLAAAGLPTGHKRKQDLIDRVGAASNDGVGTAVVWDVVAARHEAEAAGKEMLDAGDWDAVASAAAAVAASPATAGLFAGGSPEVSVFARDETSGVLLKARIDYLSAGLLIDLKTFGNFRAKPVSVAVNEAMYHEGYYRQGVYYHDVLDLARCKLRAGLLATHGVAPAELLAWLRAEGAATAAFVFVESCMPHGMDVVALSREGAARAGNELYWSVARRRQRELIDLHAACVRRYGDAPWRQEFEARTLEDADMPGVVFGQGVAA